jgi:hypothetical protein
MTEHKQNEPEIHTFYVNSKTTMIENTGTRMIENTGTRMTNDKLMERIRDMKVGGKIIVTLDNRYVCPFFMRI